jgi:hypothetical protein
MWQTFSLIGNALLLAILLKQRQRRHRKREKWPIATVAPKDIDPVFKPGATGPSKETGIHFVSDYCVPTSISDFETWIICNLAKKAEAIFEFGTCSGKTTWMLAVNAPQAMVTTLTLHPANLDSYKASHGDDEEATQWAVSESQFSAFYYQGTDAEKRIIQLFGDSKELDEQPLVRKFDLIFVDGSHAQSYVESDSRKALAMVKPGGLVLWHDYRGSRRAKDVFHVLNRLAKQIPLVHIEGTCLVAYRAPMARQESVSPLAA